MGMGGIRRFHNLLRKSAGLKPLKVIPKKLFNRCISELKSSIIDLGMVETPVLGGEDRRGVDGDPGEQAAALRPHPRLTTDRL